MRKRLKETSNCKQVYVLRPMRRRNREMLQWIRRVVTPYALVVPGDRLKANLHLFCVSFVRRHVRVTRVELKDAFLCAHFADHVIEADLDSAAGMTALWRFLGDGVALFCIAHRYPTAIKEILRSCWFAPSSAALLR